MEKKQIRKKVLDQRNAMTQETRREKSLQIVKRIVKLREYLEADALFVYRSFRTEVDTTELIQMAWKEGKHVFCPRVDGQEMEFYRVKDWEDFREGYYGIMEPREESAVYKNDPEKVLVILPGAAFDKQRHRIGYGGGFYDRFLARHPEFPTVAVCFEEQMMEEIPYEAFDIRPQKVVTDRFCYEEERNRKNE